MNFWQKLKEQSEKESRPIIVLAPMADVTDAAFRRLIAEQSRMGEGGGPDAMWTEFVSADGLMHPEARKKLLVDFLYTDRERPIVAQLFTSIPEHMTEAAKLCAELNFDGVDINMGCPDRSIEKQGCGAALIKKPKLARELIRAAKKGVEAAGKGIPVSVKTRIGYSKNELETWLPELLAEDPAVVTIHARTRKELSKVPARWEHVREAVEIRDTLKSPALIFGNGDVLSIADAKKRAAETGADGVMIGKGIFGSPWLFRDMRENPGDAPMPPLSERLRIMVRHTKLFEELLGKHKNFAIMKKHYKAYVSGFDGAKELREKLMEAKNAEEIAHITEDFIAIHSSN